jgi:hypothetical protein
MFDTIRNQYRLRCPAADEPVWTSISSFRTIKRLRGASTPAVFRVTYDCSCGTAHESLVTHDTLDYEPLATEATATFTNLLTGTRELLAHELGTMAGDLIKRGNWPWTFWCHPESAARPGFPSSLRMVTPNHDHGDERLGVLVRCFTCSRLTVNLVTRDHLDVPFHNDPRIAYVGSLIGTDAVSVEEAFRHQLDHRTLRSQRLDRAG